MEEKDIVEKQLKEELRELGKAWEATIDKIDEQPIEVVGIKLMLFELAVAMTNKHIASFVEMKKEKFEKESEEK